MLIGCGALAREVRELRRQPGLDHLDPHYLPAALHNRPATIPERVVEHVDDHLAAHPECERVIVGYGDCGTGGRLDRAIDELRERWTQPIERLPGDHCYEFLAGAERFAALVEAESATFFLTDYLARHVDTLVWEAYRLDRHPELIDMMFGNYRRVCYLAQTDPIDDEVLARSAAFAERIGCEFEVEPVGVAPFDGLLRAMGAP